MAGARLAGRAAPRAHACAFSACSPCCGNRCRETVRPRGPRVRSLWPSALDCKGPPVRVRAFGKIVSSRAEPAAGAARFVLGRPGPRDPASEHACAYVACVHADTPPLLPFPRACSWQCQKIRQFATKVDRRFQTSPSTSQCLMAPPRLWRSVGRPMRARAQRVSLSVCQPKHGRVDTHSR